MRFVMMICGGPPDPETGEDPATMGCGGWSDEMLQRGVLVGGEALEPPGEAATVRVRKGEVLVSDGPFAETKEQIGGFCLLECANLDEALEIAAKHPVARVGSIEVRPVWTPGETGPSDVSVPEEGVRR